MTQQTDVYYYIAVILLSHQVSIHFRHFELKKTCPNYTGFLNSAIYYKYSYFVSCPY